MTGGLWLWWEEAKVDEEDIAAVFHVRVQQDRRGIPADSSRFRGTVVATPHPFTFHW